MLVRALSLRMFPIEVLQDDHLTIPEASEKIPPMSCDDKWRDRDRLVSQEVKVLIGADGLTDRQRQVVSLYLQNGLSVEEIRRIVQKQDGVLCSICDIDLCLACAFDIMREREGSRAIAATA
jgi:hypothetical protein